MFELLLLPIGLATLFSIICFCYYSVTLKPVKGPWLVITEIISIVGCPFLYLAMFDMGNENSCCGDSAVFSPQHRLSIYVIIILCMVAYFYSGYRKSISTPVVEVVINTLLIIGFVLNMLIFQQNKEDQWISIIGNTPIMLLYLMRLAFNQQRLIAHIKEWDFQPRNVVERIAMRILLLNPIIKFPLLLLLCLPLLIIITTALLLVGQKPDSMIRAFTDTYRHGFSQLDHMCDNVDCGGHFLCSVAAKGHKGFVKPTRLGIRNERLILCNRQLLVSNAFEDLLQQKLPRMHKFIRRNYNHVGNFIHRYYNIFNNKWVSDVVYVIMKPAEWFFLLVLYTFDKNPENRIAKQYISSTHRQQLAKH